MPLFLIPLLQFGGVAIAGFFTVRALDEASDLLQAAVPIVVIGGGLYLLSKK